jgi:uncharacterized protein
MSGISYLASDQWQVAALQTSYLAAICAWEGINDFYREWAPHGEDTEHVRYTASPSTATSVSLSV